MDTAFATVSQAAHIASNVVKYVASELGYELDTTTIASTLFSIIAVYFALLTLYRTTLYAVRTVFWLAKWGLILWLIGGSVGWVMTGGSKGFTLAPLLELAFAYTLRLIGWGSIPDVTATPDGIRVNGIPLELPADYHQYGDAWKKFQSRSTKNKSSKRSRSIFDAFDSKPSSNKKSNKQADGSAAAIIAQQVLGDAFDFDAAQSVEAIQKGVADSFKAVKKAVLGGQPEELEQSSGWTSWWPFSDDDDTNKSAKNKGSGGGTGSR